MEEKERERERERKKKKEKRKNITFRVYFTERRMFTIVANFGFANFIDECWRNSGFASATFYDF